MLVADRQARRGLMAPWAIGKNAKEYRAALGRKPIVGIFSVGVEEPYRWKDSVQNAAEIRLWVADLVANGMRPWFTKFCGALHDERWLKPVEELYRRLAGWETLPAQRAAAGARRPRLLAADRVDRRRPDRGPHQGLVPGARRSAHPVRDGARPAARRSASAFKTLILPNVVALSDAQCRQLERFVARGGSVVATHETSLYDERGDPPRELRPGTPVRRGLRREDRGAHAERLPARSSTTPAPATRCCAAWRTRRASSTASPASR